MLIYCELKMTKNKIKDVLIGIIQSSTSPKAEDESGLKIKGKKSKKTGVKKIHVSEIRASKERVIRDNLLEWKNNDFAMYFINLFRKKVYQNWEIQTLGATLYMGQIKESISSALGFCDNIVLKDYMDFFVDNWGKFYYKKTSNFYVGSMKDDAPIKDFVSKYDYKSSFNRIMSQVKQVDVIPDRKSISTSDIDPVFLSGGDNMVLEYGLLLPVNWLIKVKKYSEEKAINYVASAFKRVYTNGDWMKIVKRTNDLSPYPDWFQVKDCKAFLLSAEEEKLQVSFSKDSNYFIF